MKPPKFLIPVIIVLGVVLFQSAFIVQEINQAIVLQFGNPKRIITDAGLKFKLPFIQNVVYLDTTDPSSFSETSISSGDDNSS